jgi:uncharacterized protein YcgI (DUF1989 family)
MDTAHCFTIAPRSAAAFAVRQGQTLRITDVAGRQPGDLVAFRLDDLRMRSSPSRTRVENRSVRLTAGQALWSGSQPPEIMLTAVHDTGGPHDLLYTPCCRYALAKRFGVTDADGCLENLARELWPFGVSAAEIPDPLNLFFRVSVAADGSLAVAEADSAPGAQLDLRADMDCLVAVSTCAVPHRDRPNTGYRIEIIGRR